jgi:hypothetical protein
MKLTRRSHRESLRTRRRIVEEEDELETTDDEMSFQDWKVWKKKKKLQRKKGKFNTKIVIESMMTQTPITRKDPQA